MSKFLEYIRTKGPELLIGGAAAFAGAIGLYGLIRGSVKEFKDRKKIETGFGLRRVVRLEDTVDGKPRLDGEPSAFAEFEGGVKVPLYDFRVGNDLHYVPGGSTMEELNKEKRMAVVKEDYILAA
jgi:hypothetical protein